MEAIYSFLDWIYQWFTVDIYEFFKSMIEAIMDYLGLLFIGLLEKIVDFAWTFTDGLLSTLNFDSQMDSAWAALPAESASMLQFFNVPEFLAIIFSAFATKFVLRFLPGF